MHMNNIIAFPTKAELNNLKMSPKPYNQCEEIPQKELDLSFMYIIQRKRNAERYIEKVKLERLAKEREKARKIEIIKSIFGSIIFFGAFFIMPIVFMILGI